MPNIKPISDLRSYTAVLDEVAQGSPVFLTKNGRGRLRCRLLRQRFQQPTVYFFVIRNRQCSAPRNTVSTISTSKSLLGSRRPRMYRTLCLEQLHRSGSATWPDSAFGQVHLRLKTAVPLP